MRGFKIASIKLDFYEEAHHRKASVTVEWVHNATSAADILKMCGGIDVKPAAMLGCHNDDMKGLKTARTFRFENREDALEAYDKFEEALRAQKNGT